MKNVLVNVFAVICMLLFCFPAVAESIHLEIMSFDELMKLRQQIDIMLIQHTSDTDLSDNTYNGLIYVSNGSEIQINSYTGNDSTLIIPDNIEGTPVTRIGGRAFREGGKAIKNLIIPEGIKHIGDFAFYGLNIEGILMLPSSLEYIGDRAFDSGSYNGIVVQGSPAIKYMALEQDDNPNIKFVYFREGCSPEFHDCAHFSDLESLELIIIPESIRNLPDEFICDCPNVTIVCPAGSYAESYAKEHWIVCNTIDYDKYVAEYEALIAP
ncbi:MAG: leucine-rich repeat protein [Clostridia bacterium]|nr:leucine-rich repeat protein [Clostridia bacterium]